MTTIKHCQKCGADKPVSEFYVKRFSRDGKSHWCKLCCKKSAEDRYAVKRDHILALNRIWAAKNKDRHTAARKKWSANNPEKQKLALRKAMLRQYGLTIEQYEDMFRSQNGMCAICNGFSLAGRRLAVDHNHNTGKVRQLLCSICNTVLGMVKERPERLEAMIEYLAKHSTPNSGASEIKNTRETEILFRSQRDSSIISVAELLEVGTRVRPS